ncbi:MAG TPA: SMP-30/gluconolactonase/LRE family protein [Caulobacteraceae bacterium]|jgi:sugar lactone lactonase YvrE
MGKALSVIASGICTGALLLGQASAQPAAPASAPTPVPGLGKAPACTPPPPAQPPGAAPPAQPRRDLPVTAIAGVIAGGQAWKKLWQQAGNGADGLIPDQDGNVLMAQEDSDTVLRLMPDGTTSVAVADAKGIGAVSMDRQGRLYGAHRTERPGSTKADRDQIFNAIRILTPAQQVIGQAWAGGAPAERPNDVIADNRGGAWFTAVCLYHASPRGVTTVADNLNANGVDLSPDEKTLYVTNGPTIVAFDVKGPGKLVNRRDFATLQAGGSGDGMAVDTAGRLYVSSGPGVQVFDKTGRYLGLIPSPRAVISITIAGPDRQTLYMAGSGADDDQGKPIRVGPQQTAATVYAIPLLAQGLKGHAK